MVFLNEKVALEEPMLVRVCLNLVESVTETEYLTMPVLPEAIVISHCRIV